MIANKEPSWNPRDARIPGRSGGPRLSHSREIHSKAVEPTLRRQCPLTSLHSKQIEGPPCFGKNKENWCMTHDVGSRNQTPNLEIWTPNQKSKLQMRYPISNRELQPQIHRSQIQVQIKAPNSELEIRNPNSNLGPSQQLQSRNQKSSPKSKLTDRN